MLNLLTGFSIVLITFSGLAQVDESTLEKLKANTWRMQDLTDKEVSTKYRNRLIKKYYKEEEFKSTFRLEFYLSNTIDKEFNSNKVGKTSEGKYIISRKKRKIGDHPRPFPITVLEIVQINKNWLILRNVKHQHLLKYKAE